MNKIRKLKLGENTYSLLTHPYIYQVDAFSFAQSPGVFLMKFPYVQVTYSLQVTFKLFISTNGPSGTRFRTYKYCLYGTHAPGDLGWVPGITLLESDGDLNYSPYLYTSVTVPSETAPSKPLLAIDCTSDGSGIPGHPTMRLDILDVQTDLNGDIVVGDNWVNFIDITWGSYVDLSGYELIDPIDKSTQGTNVSFTQNPAVMDSGHEYELGTLNINGVEQVIYGKDQYHIYTLVGVQNTTGMVKNGSPVTDPTGYTPCPIIDAIPYYRTLTLPGLGIHATAAEINQLQGIGSNVQTQLNNKLSTSGGTMQGDLDMGDHALVKSGHAVNPINQYTKVISPQVGQRDYKIEIPLDEHQCGQYPIIQCYASDGTLIYLDAVNVDGTLLITFKKVEYDMYTLTLIGNPITNKK